MTLPHFHKAGDQRFFFKRPSKSYTKKQSVHSAMGSNLFQQPETFLDWRNLWLIEVNTSVFLIPCPLRLALIDPLCKLRNGWSLKKRFHRNDDLVVLTYQREDACCLQRIAPQLKKVLLHSQRRILEHLSPDRQYTLLVWRLWDHHFRRKFFKRIFVLPQCTPVCFSIGGARKMR